MTSLEQEAESVITDADVIQQLATLSPLDYDRTRTEKAKELKIRPATLDSLVKQAREGGEEQTDFPFENIEPWHKTIIPVEVIDEITNTILKFILMDRPQAQAAALWVAASWFADVVDCAPILLINAPEKSCGKTHLLTVIAKLAPRTAQACGISPSVLFRMVERYKPTLFIDEIETVLKENEELRGLLNAGHTRDSAYVWRSVAKGDDFEPKRFSVWGYKAAAGINAIKLAETVTSRSIVIELRRKKPEEKVSRLRHAEKGLFENLASKLARFANDYSIRVMDARPNLPDELSDRDQDNWEPLLQVASIAGGHWPDTALKAALKLSGIANSAKSTGNELLSDIQNVFETRKLNKIGSAALIEALCEDTEAPWATYNRGKPLSPRQLSTKLAAYDISSKNIRPRPYEVIKGYELTQFEDAFTRYLTESQNLPLRRFASPEANNGAVLTEADEKNIANKLNSSASPEALQYKAGSGAADKQPILGVTRETLF